ncbi:MAG: hypothetical protein QW112_03415, partial [Candidatus Micrarchaeia archaeon]
DELTEHKCYSLHDFDLAMSLKLMQKMGKLKRVRIIGIPPKYPKQKALEELKKKIISLFPVDL